MPELLKALISTEDEHYHIVYVLDDGSGITTLNADHIHQIIDGIVLEAAEDLHVHTLDIYPVKDISLKENNTDEEKKLILTEVLDDWYTWKENEEGSVAKGNNAEDFYMHKQWDKKDSDKLKGEDRAIVTVNQIEKTIDNLSGYQRQNRTDIKFLPNENGDQVVSDILNIITKVELDNCFYPREETKVFEDTAITGRGLFNLFMDFNAKFMGKITIEKFKWNECTFAPHEKEDLTDCEGIVKHKWYSGNNIKQMYPEYKNRFSPEVRSRPSSGTASEDWDKRLNSSEYVDIKGGRYKVLEREKKIYRQVFTLANAMDNFYFDADGWKKSDVEMVKKSIEGFSKIQRIVHTIRITKIASDILLEDYYNDPDETDFSIIPLYAKFRNNEFWGKIEGVKDLARLINKAYSQFVDIISKVANYGWFYDKETFGNEKNKKAWLKNSAKPGFNQEVDNTDKLPVRADELKFPSEIVGAIDMFNRSMRDVMNVNMEMLGLDSQAQSGVAIRQKIAQQLIGNDYLYDNLSFVKKLIGRRVIKFFKKYYPAERLMRILNNQAQKEEIQLANEPIEGYTEEQILVLLNTIDLADHDVTVSESPESPSAMMANFLMLMELASKGVGIPAAAIIEFAPIPEKQKIIKMIEAENQSRIDQENKKYDTELQKTVIAKGDDAGGAQVGQ